MVSHTRQTYMWALSVGSILFPLYFLPIDCEVAWVYRSRVVVLSWSSANPGRICVCASGALAADPTRQSSFRPRTDCTRYVVDPSWARSRCSAANSGGHNESPQISRGDRALLLRNSYRIPRATTGYKLARSCHRSPYLCLGPVP
jgi:hypothetical protein